MTARRLLAAAFAATLALSACGGDDGAPSSASVQADSYTWDYTIPLGSAARADAGEHLTIFPSRIDAKVGDTLRIVNLDDRPHELGPYVVLPGQTLTQRFTSPGTYEGVCTTHPDSQFVLSVSA